MADRNIFGKWQDLVAGPVNQPSNIDLLRALLRLDAPDAGTPFMSQINPLLPQGTSVSPQMTRPMAPQGIPQTTPYELPPADGYGLPTLGANLPNMRMPEPRASLASLAANNPNLRSPINPQMEQQRNNTLQTTQVPTQPLDNSRKNQMLMAALFGGIAPGLAAAFGGDTGLAAGAGMAQGFSGQYNKEQELQKTLASKPYQPITREEQIAFEKEKMGIKSESPAEKAKKKRYDFVDSTKIRDEFINRPEVKEYITINTQVSSMDSLLRKAKAGNLQNKVALDQALITMYNKLTDPNSVVRESEYARTAGNLPLANQFTGALQKLEKGGAGLTDSDREALVWGAKVIADERGKTYNTTLNQYKGLGKEYDIDEKLITRGLEPHKNHIEQETSSALTTGTVEDGYKFKGGDPADKNNWEKI